MAEDVDVSGSAYDGMVKEMQSRDFGTSDDDLKAYAQAAGGAAGAAGCAYVGAAAIAPLCAEIGGTVAGKVYDFIKNIFSSGPSDEDLARLANSARFGSGWEITKAFETAANDATHKTYDMVRQAANRAGLQPSNQDIALWLSQNCVGCWYVSKGVTGSGDYPWGWCYGCNTPDEYFRSYQDWGMPTPPGWPPDKRVAAFIPAGTTTQAHIVAAQEYYRRTFQWILHDLMKAASGVIAKLATGSLKIAFGADGKVHLKLPTALVQWRPQGEATAGAASSSSSSSGRLARDRRAMVGAAAGAALGAGIGALVDRRRRGRGALAGALAGALVGNIVGAAL